MLGEEHPFASRGGIKLQHALEQFKIDARNKIALDIGASTGGFTDCLLQKGAKKIYAVDVGYGQLDWKLRNDPRVICMDRINARNLKREDFCDDPQLVVVDVSFISLKLILPPLFKILKQQNELVALVKPQFEVGRDKVGKGGVVREDSLREEAVHSVLEAASSAGWTLGQRADSRLEGPSGNREIFVLLRPDQA